MKTSWHKFNQRINDRGNEYLWTIVPYSVLTGPHAQMEFVTSNWLKQVKLKSKLQNSIAPSS